VGDEQRIRIVARLGEHGCRAGRNDGRQVDDACLGVKQPCRDFEHCPATLRGTDLHVCGLRQIDRPRLVDAISAIGCDSVDLTQTWRHGDKTQAIGRRDRAARPELKSGHGRRIEGLESRSRCDPGFSGASTVHDDGGRREGDRGLVRRQCDRLDDLGSSRVDYLSRGVRLVNDDHIGSSLQHAESRSFSRNHRIEHADLHIGSADRLAVFVDHPDRSIIEIEAL